MTHDLLDTFVTLAELSRLRERAANDEALELATRALGDLEDTGGVDDFGVAATFRATVASFASAAALDLQRYTDALRFAEIELAAAMEPGVQPVTQARAHMHRALALEAGGLLQAAENDYRAAMELVAEDPLAEDVRAAIELNYGEFLFSRQPREQGIEAMALAVSAPAIGTYGDSRCRRLNNRASVLVSSGDPRGAISVLEEALDCALALGSPHVAGVVTSNLCSAHAALGELETAIRRGVEARDLLREAGTLEALARALHVLGTCYMESERLDDAVESFKEAWTAVREIAPRSLTALRILESLAHGRLVQWEFPKARGALKRGLDTYEQMRPAIGSDETEQEEALSIYRGLVELHLLLSIHEAWTDEAMSLVERSKARFWFESIAKLRSSEPHVAGPSMTRGRREGADPYTEASWSAAKAFSYLTWHDALVLDFFVGQRWTFLTHAWRGRVGAKRISIAEPELQALVEEFRFEILRSQSRSMRHEATDRLSELLLGDNLPLDDSRLIIVLPDGPLWSVPFDALRTGRKPAEELIEVAPVLANPSAGVLAALERPGDASSDVRTWSPLVVAEPDLGSAVPPIPGTREQFDVIRSTLDQASDGRWLSGRRASKDEVLDGIERATHIHIASHAYGGSDDDRPHILLSDGRGGADRLYPDEISDLRLRADLVFLSACSTSTGRRSAGEGLMSVARAFLLAGSRCVIGTLWPIADAGAVDLVRHFYVGLVDDASPARALHDAKLELRSRGASARLWAAPQVIGDAAGGMEIGSGTIRRY